MEYYIILYYNYNYINSTAHDPACGVWGHLDRLVCVCGTIYIHTHTHTYIYFQQRPSQLPRGGESLEERGKAKRGQRKKLSSGCLMGGGLLDHVVSQARHQSRVLRQFGDCGLSTLYCPRDRYRMCPEILLWRK